MEINDVVMLNKDSDIRVFYYNNDPNFNDYENQFLKEGNLFTIIGYVPELSNKIRRDKVSGDFDNYAFVIRNNLSAELFRVERTLMNTHFIKIDKH